MSIEKLVLYVDDESLALKYFARDMEREFKVITAESVPAALEILRERADEIAVLLTDQRMPGHTGVELLERVRSDYPHIVRILVTAYSDLDSAVAAINTGAVFKYVSKPWDSEQLFATLQRAFDRFHIQQEKKELIAEKLSCVKKLMILDRVRNFAVLAMGLECRFRNTLQAVQAFADEMAVLPVSAEEGHSMSWKSGDDGLSKESDNLVSIVQRLATLETRSRDKFSNQVNVSELIASEEKSMSTQGSDGSALQVSSEGSVPEIVGNADELGLAARILLECIQNVAMVTTKMFVALQVVADQTDSNMLEVVLTDGEPEWTEGQRSKLFCATGARTAQEDLCGLDLFVAYILIHHHGGRLKILGESSRKMVVYLPLDARRLEGSARENQLFRGLFERDNVW